MTRITFLRIGILTQWIHVVGGWSRAPLMAMYLFCKYTMFFLFKQFFFFFFLQFGKRELSQPAYVSFYQSFKCFSFLLQRTTKPKLVGHSITRNWKSYEPAICVSTCFNLVQMFDSVCDPIWSPDNIRSIKTLLQDVESYCKITIIFFLNYTQRTSLQAQYFTV